MSPRTGSTPSNGIDWRVARTELRSKVESASSPEEVRHHIEALLDRIGHSHVGIIPAAAYTEMNGSSGQGISGLRFEIIGGDAVIATGPYSSMVLREVNGRRVRERIARVKSEPYAHLAIRNMLHGEPGESVDLLLEDESGKASLAKIELTGGVASYKTLKSQSIKAEFKFVGQGLKGTTTTLSVYPGRSNTTMELSGLGKIHSGGWDGIVW